MNTIILASGSPRRRELLELADVPFIVQTADVDETIPEGISPEEAVQLLAVKKSPGCAGGKSVGAGGGHGGGVGRENFRKAP